MATVIIGYLECNLSSSHWILRVVSKQPRLLHMADCSTTLENSLNPQMSELVEDAVAF